jgi:hypothetical protein
MSKLHVDFRNEELDLIIQELMTFRPVRSSRNASTSDLVLRFDIDYSIFPVNKVLDILDLYEDVSASFFFLTTSQQYNIFSSKCRSLFNRIIASGHEIGLHLDVSNLSDFSLNHQEGFNFQKGLLETATGVSIDSYSTHNPSVTGYFESENLERNLYASHYFSPSRYISDSKLQDPMKIFHNLKNSDEVGVFQVLLHPENFMGNERNYVNNLYTHLDAIYRSFREEFSVNKNILADLAKLSNLKTFIQRFQ